MPGRPERSGVIESSQSVRQEQESTQARVQILFQSRRGRWATGSGTTRWFWRTTIE